MTVGLFDTGAAFSLITLDRCRLLGLEPNKSDLVKCHGIGGHQKKIYGSVFASIWYGDIETECKFYVTDYLPNGWDLVLGTPYMIEHECSIQYSKNHAILHVGTDELIALKGDICPLEESAQYTFGSVYSLSNHSEISGGRRKANANKNKANAKNNHRTINNDCRRTLLINNKIHSKSVSRSRASSSYKMAYTDVHTHLPPKAFILYADKTILKPEEMQLILFRLKGLNKTNRDFPFGKDVLVTKSNDYFSSKIEILDQIASPDKDGSILVYIVNKSEEPVHVNGNLRVSLQEVTHSGSAFCLTALDKKFKALKGPEETENDAENCLPTFTPLSDDEKRSQIREFVQKNMKNKSHQKLILDTLLEFSNAIYVKGDKLGSTNTVKHHIEVEEGTGPIFIRQYKLPEAHREEINRQVSDMLKQGLVEECESEFNNPLFIVQQKNKMRIVVDFRKLNAVTKKSHWPIPNMNSVLANLGGSKYFSSADLASGFHQISLSEQSRNFCAFSTDTGSYRFRVMPFGLTNAPSTCARLMNVVLAGLSSKAVLVYLDDLIILGNSLDEHISNIRAVLKRLIQHGLKIKLEKCNFLANSLEFLGHTIDEMGMRPDDKKLAAISEAPEPKNAQEIKSFIGLISFYRDYIPNCSSIAEPLIKLTRKGERFSWKEEQIEAFTKLKVSLTRNLKLIYPDFRKPFILFTDASNVGTGCCLAQMGSDNKILPIRFSSKALNQSERNYSTFDRELLAILHGIRANRQFILGNKTHIYTDHKPLSWLLSLKEPKGRLARWLTELLQYDLEFSYLPGSTNSVADFLSRFPIQNPSVCSAIDDDTLLQPIKMKEIRVAQSRDRFCIGIKAKLRRSDNSKPKYFIIKNGIVYYNRSSLVPFIPPSLRDRALRLSHDSSIAGHGGFHSSRRRLLDFAYWQGYELDLKRHIRNCNVCNIRKPKKTPSPPMGDTPPALYPNHRIHLDLIGRLDTSPGGYEYILSIVCGFSRFLVAVPLQDKRAETVAKVLLDEYISKFGPPAEIYSDRGREFLNEILKYLATLCGTNLHYVCPGTPQANGVSERSHATLMNILRTLTIKRPNVWDEFLPLACLAYNTKYHDSIRCSPYLAFFGREPLLPQNFFAERPKYYGANDFVQSIQENMAEAYDLIVKNSQERHQSNKDRKNKRSHEKFLEPGQIVYLKNVPEPFKCSKLQDKFKGPYVVVRRISSLVYEILNKQTKKSHVEHIHRLKFTDKMEKLPCDSRETTPKNMTHNYDLRPRRK